MSSSYFAALLKKNKAEEYEWSPDPSKLEKLHDKAWTRDMYLNEEEREAKNSALQECELGRNWWLRGHP